MTQAEKHELLDPLDDRPGPAKRITAQRADDLISEVIDRASEAGTAAPRSLGPRRWRRVALVAAALLVAAGGASAAIYELVIDEPERADEPEESAPAASTEAEREAPPPVEVTPIPAEEPPPDPAPPSTGKRPRAKPTRDTGRRVVDETPDDLLARANQRRKAREWRDAAALYERVRAEHRSTTAAYVATLASASIHLEHLGDARKALALYRAAMRARPHGYLAEEARYGIAEAHRARGERAAEAEALAEFLSAHPDSPLRERAELRLRDIAPGRGAGTGEGSAGR